LRLCLDRRGGNKGIHVFFLTNAEGGPGKERPDRLSAGLNPGPVSDQ